MRRAVTWLVVGACACSPAAEDRRTDAQALLSSLWALASHPALSRDAVASTLEVEFQADAAQSNPYFTFHVGRPRQGSVYAGQIASVDLREPNTPSARGVFVVVELTPKTAPTRDDLQARWGPPVAIDVVEPNLTVEAYLAYEAPGGRVGFGIAPGARGSVVSVSIDRLRTPPAR